MLAYSNTIGMSMARKDTAGQCKCNILFLGESCAVESLLADSAQRPVCGTDMRENVGHASFTPRYVRGESSQ